MQKISTQQKRIKLNPWLTKGLLISIKHKQKFYRTHFLNGDSTDKCFHKKYANKLTRVKTLSTKMYFNNAVDERKNKPKELWKFINSVIPHNIARIHPPKLIKDGKALENPEEISEEFNNYFLEIGLTIANFANPTGNNDFKTYLKCSVSSSIVLIPHNQLKSSMLSIP